MPQHDVVIAGGGPTGMMLGAELALAGINAITVERRLEQERVVSRAGGLHSRTIEVLDQRGVAERFLAAGRIAQVVGFSNVSLDISDFPTRHNYGLALWQTKTEGILADWVGELGAATIRGVEVTGFVQDDRGVDVQLSSGATLRTKYLVACDGGRSVIRKAAGIAFPGSEATTSFLIAEVEMDEQPPLGMRHDRLGSHGVNQVEEGVIGLVLTERQVEHDRDPSIDDLREAVVAVFGTDFGLRSARWISRFTDMTRQAAAYRAGRVLLAGDAAHVHPPYGGQGLNLGVQDAVNLGWKLAQVVRSTSPESLLDSYHAERHPVTARVLNAILAGSALRIPDERHQAVRDIVAELLTMDAPRKRIAGLFSGLDVHYDLGEGHPLLGRRMPDLDIETADGPTRVFAFLRHARPVLLNLGAPGGIDIAPWADRVPLVDARYDGNWELPVVGQVIAPSAVLVRPDGYAAWVGEGSQNGLVEALTTWFGAGLSGVARSAVRPSRRRTRPR